MANTVEIVLAANDQAGTKIGAINAGLVAIGKSASTAAIPIQTLSRAVLDLGAKSAAQLRTGLLNPLGTISTVLGPAVGLFGTVNTVARDFARTVQEISSNPIIRPAVLSILAEAERSIQSLDASLTDTFQGTAQAVTPLLQGIIPQFDQFSSRASASVQRIGQAFSGLGTQIGPAIANGLNRADALINGLIEKFEVVPARIANRLQGIGNVFGAIAGFDEPLAVFNALRQGVGGITQGIFAATQEIAFFSAGLQALQQFVVQGPFQLLIGQNITLREQLLATQSSLVATSKVLQDGQQITDPAQAIQALQGPIESAIRNLREGSLELVGVTSDQLVPLFQQVAGQASGIGASLTDATDLSLSFAAALGTLNIPLFQSQQEIGSILQGTIDQNSILAKSLAITNEQVASWRSQGTVVAQLSKRLEAFRAGNALAAQTINGVSSNIQELFQEIARVAGEPLLDPIVQELTNFYQFLNDNRDGLADGIQAAVEQIERAGNAILSIAKSVFGSTQATLGQIPIFLLKSFANVLEGIASAVKTIVPILQPLVDIFGVLAQQAVALGGPFLQIFLQFTIASKAIGLLAGSFGILTQTLPGLGELLFFMAGRNNSLIRSFIGLRGEVGLGASAFLLLGKNLTSIPPLVGLLSQKIPIIGPAIAALTPQIASLGISGLGLIKTYPQVGQVFERIANLLPGVAASISPIADQLLPGLGVQLRNAAGNAAQFSTALNQSTSAERIAAIEGLTNATGRFSGLMQNLGAFVAQTALRLTLLTGGIFIAIQAIDQFILKNEGALAILKTIQGFVASTGKAIIEFLSNPFVIATASVFGLVAAIRTGLIASLIDMGKAFAATSGATLLANLSAMTQGVAAFSATLRNTRIETLFGARVTQSAVALKEAVIGLAGSVSSSAGSFATFRTTAASAGTAMLGFGKAVAASIATITATLGPIALLVAAIALVTEGISIYQRSVEAFEGSSKKLAEASKESEDKLRKLVEQRKALEGQKIAPTVDLSGLRLKEIQDGQNIITKFLESVRSNLRAIVTSFVAPFDGVGKAFEFLNGTIAKAVDALGQVFAPIQAISNVADQVGAKLGKAFEPVLATLQPIIDVIKFIQGSLGDLGISGAQAQLNDEVLGFNEALDQASTKYNTLVGQIGDAVKSEQRLADLRGQRANAQAGGRDNEVKQIDERIKLLEEELQVRKDVVTDSIKGLESLKPLNAEQARDLANTTNLYKGLLTTLDDIPNTQITPPDLPRLGTAFEQLARQAAGAEEAVKRNTGSADQFKQKSQELLQVTELQAKAGLISQDEARRRFALLANNVNAERDIQIQAQEQISASFQKSAEQRVAAYDTQITEIEGFVARGEIAESEGEQRITDVKRQQLAERIQLNREALAEEIRIAQERANATIAFIDQELKKEGLSNTERQKLLADRAAAEQTSQLAGDGSSERAQQLKREGVQLATEQAKLEQDARLKEIERASTRALRVTKEAETKRQIAIQQLVNQRQISESEAGELIARSNQQRIAEEIDAERNKLALLLENEKANADQIRESRERLLGLTLESLKTEEDAYDAYIQRVGEALSAQATERETAIQQSVNAGTQTEARAAQERAQLSIARLQAELAAETRNVNKRRELLLQLAQAERQLQDANLAVLEERLERQNQAFENAVTAQNNILEGQLSLLNTLNDALSVRVSILEAQNDLQSAVEGFLSSQIGAVATLERSDRRRQELAKATAILQFDALLQRQALEDKILATQQEQNRIALQRQKIENEIAQATLQVDIARNEGSVARGETELAQGRISQEEFDARLREGEGLQRGLLGLQQARTLIDAQAVIQPQLDAAARQANELNQGRERTEGIVNIFNNLSRREQRQTRGQLQDFFAQSAGFEGRRDLLGESRELTGQFIQNVRSGNPMAGTGIFEELTPVTSALSASLDRAQSMLPTEQSLAGQQVDLGSALTSQIESIKSTVFQVQLTNLQDLPQFQMPTPAESLAQLSNVQLPSSLDPIQASRSVARGTPEQAQQIADAIWQRFSGFGDGVTRQQSAGAQQGVKVDAINTTINLQDTGEVAKKLSEQTQQQLLETVQRANQLARSSR